MAVPPTTANGVCRIAGHNQDVAPPFRVSVLDQSPVSAGMSGSEALANTLDLARLADALGYHRYWVAEHHGGPMLAGPSPEVLIGPIAAATSAIRVGSGGVMLPHYSPLKVAESFSALAGLFPARIDLGLGRASGTDVMTTYALQRDRRQAAPDDFRDQLDELLAWLEDGFGADHPLNRVVATLPGRPETPEPWLLGSSSQSAIWAAHRGLPYAFADFINLAGADIAAHYRARFAVAAGRLRAPRTAVAVWALAADTHEEAERLASSSRMAMHKLRRGELIPVPPVEEAVAWLEAQGVGRSGRRMVLGTPGEVRAGLERLAADYGAEEVIVVTITHAHEARRRSYELIAEAVGLEARAVAAVVGA